MNFEQKIIWITGASSGIGEELAYSFSKRKSQLILSARRVDELQRVKANCAYPELVTVVPLDLEDYKSVSGIASTVLSSHKNIDILIHNGGVSQRSVVAETDLHVYEKLMNVNYMGAVALTLAVLPRMIAHNSGHIVVLSSMAGKFEIPLRSGYAAAKHALHGFFETLRAEVYDNNIKVLMVCPGFIKTQVSVNALTGSGNKQSVMDDGQLKGILPQVLSEKIISAISKNKLQLIIGGSETRGVLIKRLFPGLFAKIIRNKKVT